MDGPTRGVRRRRVFYIPGYDPFHPRRYRELYRKEGAAQAAISGYTLSIAPKGGRGTYGWRVKSSQDGEATEAEIEVLVWSDIVRDSMETGILATYGQLARTAFAYIGSGALGRLMRLRKGPVIAALYPVGMLLLQLAVAVAAGFLCAKAAVMFMDWLAGLSSVLAMDNVQPFSETGFAPFLTWPVALGVMVLILRWFKRQDGQFYAYYLMHDYAFSACHGGANPPALESRIAAFADRIAAAMAEGADEILIVGHSSGAHLAVSVLADLIRAGRVPAGTPLALLTLGQVVPMVSFLPRAWRLRADLAYLSTRGELTWVDVTAPGDGCAFALCDPVAVTGVAPEGQRWPLVLSAAFTRTLSPERWKELRWRFFRLHFQYLCAFDRPGDYDYFRITAGPVTLAERYRGRAPSRSRLTRAVSGHRSVAP